MVMWFIDMKSFMVRDVLWSVIMSIIYIFYVLVFFYGLKWCFILLFMVDDLRVCFI